MQSAYQPLYRWAWVLFFFSGLTGLIYEILWTRRLTLIFGHSILAVSTVVTAYMGGLALGSLLGGRVADSQVNKNRAGGWFVKTYGLLELFVGAWGLLSLPLLDMVEHTYFRLSAQGVAPATLSLLVFALSLLTLLPPTVAMGATLPVVGCLFSHSQEGVGAKLSRLYALNTWGAMVGAGLAGFLLLPGLGLRHSVFLAASINAAIGIFGWVLGSRHTAVPQLPPPEQVSAGRNGSGWLPLVFALSGFSSMIFQLGWTRGLALCLGGAVYSFSAILVVFLSGIALGSLIYPRLFRNRTVGFEHLAWLCVGLALSGALSVVLIGQLPLAFAAALPYASNNYAKVILLDLVVCAAVLLPPTLLMGLSFPLVTHLYHSYRGALGRSIGNIYGANTLGCILGSFGAGFFGLPLLGVQNSLQVAVSCNLLAAFICAQQSKGSWRLRISLTTLALLSLNWLLPRWNTGLTTAGVAVYTRSLDSLRRRPEPLYYKDGLTCSVAMEFPGPDYPTLRVNGKVDASLGQSDRINMNLTGLIPLMYVDRPQRVGVIGLGSGLTLAALAGSPRVGQVLCAELEQAVIDCQKYWAPYVDFVHQNPKVKLIEADGRTFILGSAQPFDIIVSEPSNPWIAGIGNLYTHEFYRDCRKKLNPDGIFLQWCNLYALSQDDLKMVLRSFFSSFPHGEIWLGGGDLMLIGGPKPLLCKPERLREYWQQHPSLRLELAKLGFLRPEEVLGQFICNWDYAQPQVGEGPRNSDDCPLLEYSAPRSLYRSVLPANLAWVLGMRRSAGQLPAGVSVDARGKLDVRMGNFACVFRDMVEVSPDPDIPPEYARLFSLFQQANRQQPVPPGAAALFQQFPQFTRAHLEFARRALEASKPEEALQLLPATVLAQLKAPEEIYLAHAFLAQAYKQLDRWPAARPSLETLQKMRPRSSSAADLSDCFWSLKEVEPCKTWAQRALQLNPFDSRALLNLGLIGLQDSQLPEAESLLKRSLEIYPLRTEGWIQLARLYSKQNQPGQARDALEHAIRFAPDERKAEELRQILRNTGL